MSTRTCHAHRPLLIASVWAAMTLGVTSCGVNTERADESSRAAPDIASAPMSANNADEGVATEQTPVYWVGTGAEDGYLFREFRSADVAGIADPVAEAVVIMTAESPLDENYRSMWSAVETVGTSVSPDGMITVDLPAAAFNAQLSSEDAHLALQQLVYTVSAASVTAGLLDAGITKQIRVLVDGDTGYNAFGSVELNGPIDRDASLMAPVWLIDPQTDTRSPSPVPLFGRVLPEVKSARWEVTSNGRTVASGDVADSDATAASTAGTEFRVPVELDPGEYVVRVSGELADGNRVSDDHTVTVVED